jgi:signal transduction histidine kinase
VTSVPDTDARTPIAAAGPTRSADGGVALALQAGTSAILAAVVTVVWAAAGAGSFWPAWVWIGLGLPLALHAALRLAWSAPPGPWRPLTVQGAVSAVVVAAQVAVWALAGGGAFWPVWPALGFGTLLALRALVLGVFSGRERALEARVGVLTETRRGALDVQAAELRRIERDLHDGAQARLVALSMQLGRAVERLGDQPEVADLVRQAQAEAGAAIAELRDLARGIAPPVLADRGLVAAVEALGQRAAIPVTVEAHSYVRGLPVLETAAYFVVAEALTNAAKHAPGARARVTIAVDERQLEVEVSDDGPGGADPGGGGLTGLRQRVAALDGVLTVASAPAAGTTVRAVLPCAW